MQKQVEGLLYREEQYKNLQYDSEKKLKQKSCYDGRTKLLINFSPELLANLLFNPVQFGPPTMLSADIFLLCRPPKSFSRT